MSATNLDTPVLEGGLHRTNWFNGRIVSREDLQRDRQAERAIHLRLGTAQGPGIAFGLEVTADAIGGSSLTAPSVTVSPGLAINRCGQTIALDSAVQVSLLQPSQPLPPTAIQSGAFGACNPPDEGVFLTGTGVYLLSIAPAQVKQGLAIVSGLGNAASACNVKEVVEGVQFHLAQVSALSAAELGDDAHLRNVAAYKFFAADGFGTGAVRDPFGSAATPPQLTAQPLGDDEVPLALLNWTDTGGLRWVDLWSVRRSLSPAADASLLGFDRSRRAALGLAMSLQFQAQLDDLRVSLTSNLTAADAFALLPPVGMVPIGSGGFDLDLFFSGLKRRPSPVFVEGARIAALVAEAILHPPVDPAAHEALWTYFVRENMTAVDAASVPAAQAYCLFVNGHADYGANARFDLGYYGYANFAFV
jgi:hypothetical protein